MSSDDLLTPGFYCKQCDKVYYKRKSWLSHVRDKHSEQKKSHFLRCDACSYRTTRPFDLNRHKVKCPQRQTLGLNPPLTGFKVPKKPVPAVAPSQPTTSEPELPPAPEAAVEPVVNHHDQPYDLQQFEPGSGDEALYNLLDSLNPPMTPLTVTVDPATSHQQVTVGNSTRASAPSAPSANIATVSEIPPATTSSSSSSMTYNVPDTDMDFMDGDQEPRTSAIGQIPSVGRGEEKNC